MSSSSSSTFHPGLTFATLVVQFATTRGSVITSFEPRRKGSGEDTTAPVAPQSSAPGSPSSSSSSGQLPPASITSSVPNTSSTGISSANSNTSNSSNTSSSASSSPTGVTRTVIRSDITTAGIVGIVVGSVAIMVLALMFLTKCIRRRRRKAQGGPTTGFLRVGSSSPVRPQTPVTEMSQTQSSPLISSAVVAGATINPHLSQYSMSNTPASLSPLIFPAPSPSLHHTRSLASTSDRSAANTHTTSGLHTEISSHDALSYVSSLRGNMGQGQGVLPIISRSVSVTNSAASGEPGSPVSEPSELHHAMTMYQKSLENDPKGLDVGRMHTDKVDDSEDINDPPPSYDA